MVWVEGAESGGWWEYEGVKMSIGDNSLDVQWWCSWWSRQHIREVWWGRRLADCLELIKTLGP